MPLPSHLRPILIVDDDEHIRLGLTEVLEPLNHPVRAASNGQEALDKLAGLNPALLLLDLKMPGLSGLDVLRQLNQLRPDIPVLIITAHGDIESAVDAIRLGAAAFIEKPFSVREIRDQVRRVLDTEARTAQTEADYEHYLHAARRSIQERQLAAALQQAHMALALNAARPEAFNLMGIVKQLQMDVHAAQKYYRSALALDPAYQAARSNLENMSGFPKKLSLYDLG